MGYHLSDAPGRADVIQRLLVQSGLVAEADATSAEVGRVLCGLLDRAPSWLTLQHRRQTAAVVPIVATLGGDCVLSAMVHEWAPFNAASQCSCMGPLQRWKLVPSTFLTMSRGLLHGSVVSLRCFSCRRVFAGNWQGLQFHSVGVCAARIPALLKICLELEVKIVSHLHNLCRDS